MICHIGHMSRPWTVCCEAAHSPRKELLKTTCKGLSVVVSRSSCNHDVICKSFPTICSLFGKYKSFLFPFFFPKSSAKDPKWAKSLSSRFTTQSSEAKCFQQGHKAKHTCTLILDANRASTTVTDLQWASTTSIFQQPFILRRSRISVMINMPQIFQEDRVRAGCVRVFLALMTVQAHESIRISKFGPGCKTRPPVAAKSEVSASLFR